METGCTGPGGGRGHCGRLLRAQLVASADCIYCRYGSFDATCAAGQTTAPVARASFRRASDADVSSETLQHSPLTT